MLFKLIKKLSIAHFLVSVVFLYAATDKETELPGFKKGDELHTAPLTTRLVSTWDGYPSQCVGERHTNFDVDFFDVETRKWQKVGEILVQTKGAGSYDFEKLNIGTHVRIRSIEIDKIFQKRGIGTSAMKTLISYYEKQGGFDCFKLEASDIKPHLNKWYKKLGFQELKKLDGFNDVCIYTLKKNLKK